MTKLSSRIFLATGLALTAATAQAATLGLSAGAPVITGIGDVIYVPGTDLSFVGSDGDGLDISVVAALDPSGGLTAGVDPGAVFAESGLAGSVAALGFEIEAGGDGGDAIEVLVNVGDDPAGIFGARALAVLTGEFGTTDRFAETEIFSPATIEIGSVATPAPVPLPAGGLLLVSGLAFLRLRRRA